MMNVWTRLADALGWAVYGPTARHAKQARVEAVRDEAPGVRTITLRPARDWKPHLPGQHVRIGIVVDGRIATRTYTISSPPGRLEITVKAQGRVSQALTEIEVGTFVTLSPAMGEFVLKPAPGEPRGPLNPLEPRGPLFVTAGSGITPIASMLRTRIPDDAVHVHYCRTAEDMIFGAELRALGYPLIEVHTAHGRRSFTELVPDWRDREAWVCGPAALLAEAEAAYADRPERLHVERFRAARIAVPAETGAVTFAKRLTTRSDGRVSLLQLAEAAGLAPPHGCRMGICHSCDSTLVSGCVRDLRTGALVTEATQIQLCVCAAAGDIEVALPGDL